MKILRELKEKNFNKIVNSYLLKILNLLEYILGFLLKFQISPTDPAVKPTTKKKQNSNRSLGNEFTIKLN